MNLYCTADAIGIETGGGKVTGNELIALKSLGETAVLGREVLGTHNDPFALDDIAAAHVKDILSKTPLKIAHFYAGTFTNTIKLLKSAGVKVTYTAAAHDRLESIKEFGLNGLDYPHKHISDEALWGRYVEGYRLADEVVCPSAYSANLMKSYGCQTVGVINHGIEHPRDNEIKALPKTFNVGYLGQAGTDKGIVYLLRAWKMLRYRDSRLILAGSQTDSFLHWIRKEGLAGNIQLTGFVKSTSELFNACSVYIQPSVCEGFGIEIPEAMAHRRVVIASEGAGAHELVGDTGLTTPIRDVAAIAEAIQKCRDNKDLVDMGNRAYERVKWMSWDNIRQQYITLWKTF